jgi:hypothetical protein
MLPVAVRQPVKLGGNPQVGGLFTAGGVDPAVADVGVVSDVGTLCVVAGIFLHAADACAAGQHFGDGLHFDITQAAGIQKASPALYVPLDDQGLI